MDDEHRIREEAYKLWLAEGCPEGRAERHWTEAREIVALKESSKTTLKPLKDTIREPVEPEIAFENQGEFPELTDEGDGQPGPTWDAARETANLTPLEVDRNMEKGPAIGTVKKT
jgi:hypothetical protein